MVYVFESAAKGGGQRGGIVDVRDLHLYSTMESKGLR